MLRAEAGWWSWIVAALLALTLLAMPHRVLAASWNEDSFTFDTPEQGATLLGGEDEYIKRLSPLDRASRLKSDQPVSEQQFLQFAAAQTEPWSDHDKEALGEILTSFTAVLNALPVPYDGAVALIRTTGAEEGGAAYTRGNAIILSDDVLSDRVELRWLLAHELFHIVSRRNPALRDALYAAIGFVKGSDLALPASVAGHIVANPDTPDNSHFIRVRLDGKALCAVPVFLFTIDRYDTERGGLFFNYGELQYAVTAKVPAGGSAPPAEFSLVKPEQLTGLDEQIGRNTDYTIHPDEILAENFALLLTDSNAKSPEILDRIRAAFADPGKALPPVTSCDRTG